MIDKMDEARQYILECIENDPDITEVEKKHIREFLTTPRKATPAENKERIPVKNVVLTDDFSYLFKDEEASTET